VAELGFISTNSVQLRTDDGLSYIDLNPTTHNVTIVSPLTTINGNVQVNGTLTASVDVIGGGKSLKTHKHGGVTVGGGQTGVPV
jgi:phage baseplate assembly protein V